ncbi:uroporphyrinogen-III C-methyltransferase [Shouchella patagoniensis]|uniref:uroporphyrinogen-III C-methyltransferase n=1 Tax=Shouchella patagoniensis TaxID=228576 RepID=UPI001473219A|nr:uroporphyrinogen-III C-methyltransferase [Shouchella patagoniensis]
MVEQGSVYLVGAGPGDVGLLTVKGLDVLRKADVVIVDRLVNPILLTELKDNAKVVYCGKQPCKHTLRQEDIQKEMVIHAKKGRLVVRLKGGDPAVFGRVGEEIVCLEENGIRYEVVPGVTSGIAASMYAGVPVTHRDYSGSFAVVTAHRKTEDGKPDINWKELVHSVDTLLFYMGVKQLDVITTELIKHGKPENTPVLVTEWGTYSRQRSVVGTLKTILAETTKKNVINPAIILVGEVVGSRQSISCFENRPLSGMGILLLNGNDMKEDAFFQQMGADVYPIKLKKSQMESIETTIQVAYEASEEQAVVIGTSDLFLLFLKKLGQAGFDVRALHVTIAAGSVEVQETCRSLGFQLPLYSAKRWPFPIHLNDPKQPIPMLEEKSVYVLRRLLEEGHLTHAYCKDKTEVDTLKQVFEGEAFNLSEVGVLAPNHEVQEYASRFFSKTEVLVGKLEAAIKEDSFHNQVAKEILI